MPPRLDPPLRVERLAENHIKEGFSSGVPELDRYLKTRAGQDARRLIAAAFVLADTDRRILGYYALSSTAVLVGDLPAETSRRLPRHPLVPAALLGRLAVDERHRGQGLGRHLLADALFRALGSEVASFAVVVEALNDDARAFYERESFLPFPDDPGRLFRRMADIAILFDDAAGEAPAVA